MILSKSHIKYTCGLSVFLTIATAQALSADLRSDHDDWVGKPVEVNYYHPLLKVKAGHGLNGKRLDNTTLKALNKYRRPDIRSMPKNIEDPYAWSAYFELAEFEAAKQFCAKINGLSKKQVEEIAGQPTYRGGGLPGWKWLKPK